MFRITFTHENRRDKTFPSYNLAKTYAVQNNVIGAIMSPKGIPVTMCYGNYFISIN